MKSLSEFTSLDEAKSYSYSDWSKFGSGKMRTRLVSKGLYKFVKNSDNSLPTSVADIADAICDNMSTGDPFDFDPSTPEGIANRASFELMISECVDKSSVLTELRDEVYQSCVTEIFPYKDITIADLLQANKSEQNEVIIDDNSTEQRKLTLTITSDSPKATDIKVYQKFGTDWLHCATFVNVQYKELTYYCQVPGTTAPSRELKAVCDFNIGMSIISEAV